MNNKYTPGPLNLTTKLEAEYAMEHEETGLFQAWINREGKRIARVRMDGQERTEAMCRLIVASPDLLAACKAAERDWDTLTPKTRRALMAAIAKAEGDK